MVNTQQPPLTISLKQSHLPDWRTFYGPVSPKSWEVHHNSGEYHDSPFHISEIMSSGFWAKWMARRQSDDDEMLMLGFTIAKMSSFSFSWLRRESDHAGSLALAMLVILMFGLTTPVFLLSFSNCTVRCILRAETPKGLPESEIKQRSREFPVTVISNTFYDFNRNLSLCSLWV